MGSVGFVGLGTMGAPMAGHLVRAGLHVVVWNRTVGKSSPLREAGAKVAPSLADLADRCEVIFVCVNRSEDVRECLREMIQHAAPGTLFVDHSTISPMAAQSFATELKAHGMQFVDAPITGGSMGAQKGTLTVFCGGDEDAVAKAIDTMKPYTGRAERVGPSGSGQMMKLANQMAVGGALLALCESMAFCERAGLDLEQAMSMIGSGAGGSWAFQNYGPKLLNRDWTPGFSIKNQRKDFGYCREAARSLGAKIPATELCDLLLSELDHAGRGEETTAALFDGYLKGGE